MKLDLFEDLQKGPFEKDFALPFDLTETVISGQKHAVSGPEGISVHGKYDGSRLSLTGACDLTVTWPFRYGRQPFRGNRSRLSRFRRPDFF